MSKLIAGESIDLCPFLNMEESEPLGICIYHVYGASIFTLEEFMRESKTDLSKAMSQRYACAFEIMAKQLSEE